jgi:hypothetical protein
MERTRVFQLKRLPGQYAAHYHTEELAGNKSGQFGNIIPVICCRNARALPYSRMGGELRSGPYPDIS